MKDFLKFTLATVVGIIIVSAVGSILGLITLFGIIASSEQETFVKPKSIFTLSLDKPLEERSSENPLAIFSGASYETIGLNDVLSAIKKAGEDENIAGIYLEAGYLTESSPAMLEEIRQALTDFKQTGKFVVAYGDTYTQGEYYLCSMADKVILNPQGAIDWKGLSAQPVFFKELLEKVGIKMQIFKVGTYKSAVEPFISTSMSEANREQVSAYLHSIWNRITTEVSASRHLTVGQLNKYADRALVTAPAEEVIRCGLADTLLYKDGVKAYLKQLTGTPEDESLHVLTLDEMKNVKRNVPMNKSGNVIAVYYACGDITDNAMGKMPGEETGIVGSEVIKDLSRLREDENVKAVVLRVNSPGGSAYASEQIWNEVVKLKAVKPVIVSMSGTAASGGYYISCAADSIFAEATTITGSIGIFGMVPDMQELFTDKLGLHFGLVKTNEYSDFGDPARPMTDGEKRLLQNAINRGYDLFVLRCAEGRHMSDEAIRRVAEGRVWTGEMALGLGLVDRLGGLDEALQAAASKAGISEYTVLDYPAQPGIFDGLLEQGHDHYLNDKLKAATGEYYNWIRLVKGIQHASPVQARIAQAPGIRF